jgi:hypothetical protein
MRQLKNNYLRMKKLLLLFLSFTLTILVQATNISVPTAGELGNLLTPTLKANITELVVTGSIDARDFKCMRDELPRLTSLDLSAVSILEYNGEGGTQVNAASYPANELPQSAFFNRTTYDGKTSLRFIVLPKSITSIGHFAFYHCYNISTALIPNLVVSIGDYAFNFCSKLPLITIPATVKTIGKYSFSACSAISGFIVHPDNTDYSSLDGVLYDKNQSTLIECPEGKLGEFIIPSTVKTIANNAFFQCSKLTSITIPTSVSSIGTQAFYNCSALGAIYAYPATPAELKSGSNVFYNVNKVNCKFQVFVGSAPAYQAAPEWKEFANISDLKTVVVTAGNLFAALTPQEQQAVTKLTIKGSLDARDFKIIRDAMPALAQLDLSGVAIVAYNGKEGTDATLNSYAANVLPSRSFFNGTVGKSALQSIQLPSSLTSIGKNAFSKCSKLSSLFIPKSVNLIENDAFEDCLGLAKFTVEAGSLNYAASDGVLYDKAFTTCLKCPSAKKGNCILPNSVTKIEDAAFENCNVITAIQLASGLSTISSRSFLDCKALDKFVVLPDHPNFSVVDGVLFNKTKTTLIAYPIGKSSVYFIPKGVTKIAEDAFNGCLGMSSVTIPASVNAIGARAFSNCINLNSVFVNNSVPIALGVGTDVFGNVNKKNCVLHVPTGLAEIYKATTQWQDFTNVLDALTVNILAGGLQSALSPEDLLSVTKLTVTGSMDATDFKCLRDAMPALLLLDISAVTVLAYTGNGGTLNGVNTYPANVLPQNAFFDGKLGKSLLKTIYLPNYISSIGQNAFAKCSSLTTLNIPELVTTIGIGAFEGCVNLTDINIAAGNLNYSSFEGVLCNKNQTTILVCPMAKKGAFLLPETVTTIANNAFQGCQGLTTFRIGSAVKSIGSSSFRYCTGLKSIQIPASVNAIGNLAFANCTALTEFVVDLDNQNYSTLDGVLFNKKRTTLIACPATKKGVYNLPASVTQIAEAAFLQCKELTVLQLPSSLSSIGSQAFAGCTDLKSIYLDDNTPISLVSAADVFKDVDLSNCILHVPAGSVPLYQSAKQWQAFLNITDVKTITVTAGNLSAALSRKELSTITQLIVSGTIDARDFKCLRDSMTSLSILDLTAVGIKSYKGEGGTAKSAASYPANELPIYAFGTDSIGKTTLKSVLLPATLTTISTNAFSKCSGLKSLTIPVNVSTIANTAFNGCISMVQLLVESDNRNFSSLDGVLFNKNQNILLLFPKGKKGAYTIPSTVGSIAENAFNSCVELTEITIPKSVNLIRTQAFAGCVQLREIYASGINPVMLKNGSNVFLGVNKATCVLHVPAGSVKGYKNAQQWQEFGSLTDEKMVEIVAGGLFSSLSYEERSLVSSLKIKGSIDARDLKCIRDEFPMLLNLNLQLATIQAYTGEGGTESSDLNYAANEIPHYSFCKGSFGNSHLKNVVLPATITSIANNAFSFCSALETIELPAGIKKMGDAAFLYCTALKGIELPDGITSVGRNAFYRCGALRSIKLGSSITSIGKEAFYDCIQLDSINLPNALQLIESRAFAGCSKLVRFKIPAAVNFIGNRAFLGCYRLSEIDVQPENTSFSSLDGVLFSKNNDQLLVYPRAKQGAYIVPNSVKVIADFAFLNCKNLTEISFPNSLTTIGGWSFSFCTALKSILLPPAVRLIGNQAFAGCSALNSIVVESTSPLSLVPGSDVFLNIDKSKCVLKVPATTIKTYKQARQWQDFLNLVKL